MDLVRGVEELGFDTCWTSEAYGSDAISPAAYILAQTQKIKVGTAIMQMPARAPTMTAMTATTLNQLSDGRFIVGLGPSGPQVVEGWYGASYARPLTRLREYIEIMRKVWAREAPLEYDGFHYQMPFRGEGSSGLGKPLKSILHTEHDIKIYTAALKPKALATSAEIADGFFPIWMNPERFDLFRGPVQEGLDKAGKTLDDFDVAPFVTVVMSDDVETARQPVKMMMALYIGGMGARGKNFYNTLATEMGYGEAAKKIQDLYLDGKKGEAAAAVPDALVDEVALVGPADRIRDRLQAWKEAGKRKEVGTMCLGGLQLDAFRVIAEETL
jgi:F420-dependent oxidoreductase-like protein